jgi:integrase
VISRTAPITANRALAVLSRMLNLGVKWGWRDTNPCRGAERNPENKRTRYLSPAEIGKLTAALAELPGQQAANIFRMLLLTGARKGEVLGMRWDDLDLERGVWTKPGSTTKQKTEHRAPLSAPALQLLANLSRESEYVFPGLVPGAHRVEVTGQWETVCAAAELVDAEGVKTVRMHDLRHTYGSMLASAGLSLPIIGALLGHSQPATTARYAHLMDDPLRAATERVGAIVTGDAAQAEVAELRR